MKVSGTTNAQIVQEHPALEKENVYGEVYCMLIFAIDYELDIATNIVSDKSLSNNKIFEDSIISEGIDSKNTYSEETPISNLYIPRLVYEDDLCGFNKGKVFESQQIIIDCSRTQHSEFLSVDEVLLLIKSAEAEIKRLLAKYQANAEFTTLHLATYSFTETEDIAKCFLYGLGIEPLPFPEESQLAVYFTIENYTPILLEERQIGFTIRNDYVINYDTKPAIISDSLQETNFDITLRGNIQYETINKQIDGKKDVNVQPPDINDNELESLPSTQDVSNGGGNMILVGRITSTPIERLARNLLNAANTWNHISKNILHEGLWYIQEVSRIVSERAGYVALCCVPFMLIPAAGELAGFGAGVAFAISRVAGTINMVTGLIELSLYQVDMQVAQISEIIAEYMGDPRSEQFSKQREEAFEKFGEKATSMGIGFIVGKGLGVVIRGGVGAVTNRLSRAQQGNLSRQTARLQEVNGNRDARRIHNTASIYEQVENNNRRINELRQLIRDNNNELSQIEHNNNEIGKSIVKIDKDISKTYNFQNNTKRRNVRQERKLLDLRTQKEELIKQKVKNNERIRELESNNNRYNNEIDTRSQENINRGLNNKNGVSRYVIEGSYENNIETLGDYVGDSVGNPVGNATQKAIENNLNRNNDNQ